MDTTLAINPGSSSKKYAFFRGDTEVYSVRFERTAHGYERCIRKGGLENRGESIPSAAYTRGLYECLDLAVKEGIIARVSDITHVGIRIVAPHSFLAAHRVIDVRFLNVLESLATVAPLHIPYLVDEVQRAMHALPHAVLVGASDSAFHRTMLTPASLYSIPDTDREQFHVYRFGYHGLSVASVISELAELHGSVPARVVVVHVGSGVSVTAVREGKSIDTTMGLGPASGLIMSSRGGDIDSAALLHLAREKDMDLKMMEHYLNAETGLVGLTGTNDLRIVLERSTRGDARAKRALDAFMYQIHKAIHAYVGVLSGIDALVLTATASERNPYVRARIAEALTYLGCTLDADRNDTVTERSSALHTKDSPIAVYVIPTREMEEIARIARTIGG